MPKYCDSLRCRLLLIAGGVISGIAISLLSLLFIVPIITPRGHAKTGLSGVAALHDRLDNNPNSLFIHDEDTHYRLKPSFIGKREYAEYSTHRTNSTGTLGDEIIPGTDIRKIVFLGDSVTYGSGVAFEDTFSSYIQSIAGKDIQVINAGTPGWSTNQELTFYAKHLMWTRPLAVLQIFCLNDLVEYEWVLDDNGDLTMSEEIRSLGGFFDAGTTIEALRLKAKRLHFETNPRLAPLAEINNAFLKGWDKSAWERYAKEIFHPPRAKETLWIVVYIPIYNQIAALESGASEEEVCFPQKMLSTILKKKNIRFLDLTKALYSAKVSNRSVLYRDPTHLSSIGHRVVGEALEYELSRNGVRFQ